MKVKFIEATNDNQNWGKFMLLRFTIEEWSYTSAIDPRVKLLQGRGWSIQHLLIFDIETGEGAIFLPGGKAAADLNKHKIWVCPMYEPFLKWLYLQDLTDLDKLPSQVNLRDAPFAMAGYRRPGQDPNVPTGCLGCNKAAVTAYLKKMKVEASQFTEVPRPRQKWGDVICCTACGRAWLTLPTGAEQERRTC